MRRPVLGLLVIVVIAAALWATRRGASARSPKPARSAELTDAPSAWPADPAGFLVWLAHADPDARRRASASLREPGSDSDALLAAVVDALDGETGWAREFLEAVGPRALAALEARCLRGGTGAEGAFGLALRLADPGQKQSLLIACLAHGDDDVRRRAAGYVHEMLTTGGEPGAPVFEASSALRCALAGALAAMGPSTLAEEPFSDRAQLRQSLGYAIVASMDGNGTDLSALLAAPEAGVRASVVELTPAWVGAIADDEEMRTRAEAAVALVVPLLSDPDAAVRRNVLWCLRHMNDAPAPRDLIVANLDDTCEAPEVRAEAAKALRSLAAEAELRPYLRDPSPIVRAAVLDALRGSYDDPALAAEFRSALDDPDAGVRKAAAAALGTVARDAECRARLVAGLDDSSEPVRLACVDSLVRGAPPVEAIPHLDRWLREGSPKERRAALCAVGALREKAAPLEMAIVAAASAAEGEDKSRLIDALTGLPGHDERVLEALIAWTRDDGLWVRRSAILVLTRRFAERPAALDAVERALSDGSHQVAAAAAAYLAERGRNLPDVVRTCVRILEDDRARYFSGAAAIEAIGRCGVAARDAVPTLLRAMDSDLPHDAEIALPKTFAALPELAEATVPALVRRAAEGNRMALVALDGLGPAAEPCLSTALAKLDPVSRAAFDRARAADR